VSLGQSLAQLSLQNAASAHGTDAALASVVIAPQLSPGTLLLGKYRIDRVLGEGGMGIVVAATHLQLQEPVAIKFLLPAVASSADVVSRFLREARAAARLKGEHVARVLDVGVLPEGAPYLVMEYLDGSDLAARLARAGRLAVGETVDLVLQACEALAEAHSVGVVHRDIKPANLFVARRPDGTPLVKVLDFGISKMQTGGTELTRTQSAMGTPSYMSPEQMRSARDVDGRTDVWALGVVLYECMSGRRPFEGETFSALVLEVATTPTPPMSIALPAGLDRVVYRCLAKERADRFASVAGLAEALAPYAGNPRAAFTAVERARGMAATPVASPCAVTILPTVLPTTLGSGSGQVHAEPRRRAPKILGLLVGLAAVLAVGTYRLSGSAAVPTVERHAAATTARDAGPIAIVAPVDAAVDAPLDAMVDAPADAELIPPTPPPRHSPVRVRAAPKPTQPPPSVVTPTTPTPIPPPAEPARQPVSPRNLTDLNQIPDQR
jgi:hypothetical protein